MTELCKGIVITEDTFGICFEKGKNPNKDNSVLFKLYNDTTKPQHGQRRLKVIPFTGNKNQNDSKEMELYFDNGVLHVRQYNRKNKGKSTVYDEVRPFGNNDELHRKVAMFTSKVMPDVVKCYDGMDPLEALHLISKRYKSADIYTDKNLKKNIKDSKVNKESADLFKSSVMKLLKEEEDE